MLLEEQIKNIKTRSDFVAFVQALQNDFKNNPESWVNGNLNNYLESLAAWTDDMDGYYINRKLPVPENIPWRVFADILVGARVYE
jgi:hypothetical protein